MYTAGQSVIVEQPTGFYAGEVVHVDDEPEVITDN